jgi:DNA mismatch endonuclease, patch repair protein
MQAVKSRDTRPELAVRQLVRDLGLRYRLHRKNLPGKPDIAIPSLRKAIFVNGCFWHGHTCHRGARVPVHNRDYWMQKIARNRSRDRRSRAALRALGWAVLTIWECQVNRTTSRTRLRTFLIGR